MMGDIGVDYRGTDAVAAVGRRVVGLVLTGADGV